MSQKFSKFKYPIVMTAMVGMGAVALGSSLLQYRPRAARAESETAAQTQADNKSADATSTTKENGVDQNALSYTLGVNIAQSMREQKLPLQMTDFIDGFRTAFAGKPLKFTEDQMKEVLMAFQKQQMEEYFAEQKRIADEAKKKGDEFLANNKTKDGINITESGLQYRILEEGSGTKPKPADRVKVHYRGTLTDGTEFDSSYKRGEPAEFKVNGVIPGWTEALQLMSKGSKWQLYIPAKLAYGPRGAGGVIGPNEVLVFEVELLDITEQEPSDKPILNLSDLDFDQSSTEATTANDDSAPAGGAE